MVTGGIICFMLDDFCSPRQLTPGEHCPPSTTQAHQTDISPQAYHFPLITTTRVRFPQAGYIVQLQIGQHKQDYNRYPAKLGWYNAKQEPIKCF
jgi:hypothetical protein